MKIAIIGKGRVGAALASGLQRIGHDVRAVGRDATAVNQAGAPSEVIILALPYEQIDNALAALGAGVNRKIVIDATNPLTADLQLSTGFTMSGAELVQKKIPSAKVVKAFNTVFSATMATGSAKGERLSGLLAGDDASAKRIVSDLLGALGFDPIDTGPLQMSRVLEPFAVLTISLGLKQGFGTESGFRFVH